MAFSSRIIEMMEDAIDPGQRDDDDIEKLPPWRTLPNITKKFWEWFSQPKKDDWKSWIMVIYGKKRGGKTALGGCVIEQIHLGDPERRFTCYKNDELVGAFQEVADHLEVAKVMEIDDLRFGDIFYVDEGALDMNAKRSTTIESRGLEEALAYTSHQEIRSIVCAQDDSLMRGVRKKGDITIYKTLTRGYIMESHDKLVRGYGRRLRTLPKNMALVNIDYDELKNYLGGIDLGIIEIPLDDLCPWWNRKVSTNLKNSSMNRDMEKAKKIRERIMQLAETAVKLFPRKSLSAREQVLSSSKIIDWFHGWTYRKNMKIHYFFKENKTNIRYMVELLLREERDNANRRNVSVSQLQIQPQSNISFADYIRQNYPNENGEIMALLMEDHTQEEIKIHLQMNKSAVGKVVREFVQNDIGYLFEQWFALRIGGQVGGGASHDVDVIGPNGRTFSCKYKYVRAKQITFNRKDFAPEIKRARDQVKDFYIVLCNIQWHENALKVIPASTEASTYTITKDDPSCMKLTLETGQESIEDGIDEPNLMLEDQDDFMPEEIDDFYTDADAM